MDRKLDKVGDGEYVAYYDVKHAAYLYAWADELERERINQRIALAMKHESFWRLVLGEQRRRHGVLVGRARKECKEADRQLAMAIGKWRGAYAEWVKGKKLAETRPRPGSLRTMGVFKYAIGKFAPPQVSSIRL